MGKRFHHRRKSHGHYQLRQNCYHCGKPVYEGSGISSNDGVFCCLNCLQAHERRQRRFWINVVGIVAMIVLCIFSKAAIFLLLGTGLVWLCSSSHKRKRRR